MGVYGGTFNPVHIAHLILAEEMRERFGLDRVLFVPSGRPPHKEGRLAEGRRRLQMVRLAIAGNENFEALDLEVKRRGPSFTIETLRELRRRFPRETSYYFLIGMDAFREITTWHEAEDLLDCAHFVIFPRPGFPLEHPGRWIPDTWKTGAPVRPKRGVRRYPVAGRKSLYLTEAISLPVSASEIRGRVRHRRSIRYLVPEAVEKYIRKNKLYSKKGKGV